MHPSVTEHQDKHHFTFDEKVCDMCAAQARYGRAVSARDESQTPRDKQGNVEWPRCGRPGHPPNCTCGWRPGDGRHIFIRELRPDEVAERNNLRRA